MQSQRQELGYGMFKNGQLALLPQHMWQENKHVRGGMRRKKERRERNKQTNKDLSFFFSPPPVIPTFDLQTKPENWEKREYSACDQYKKKYMHLSGRHLCTNSSSSLFSEDVWSENKKIQSDSADDGPTEEKRKKEEDERREGEDEEKQSETVIRLQSGLLSDLFRILNRRPDTAKQKMKR